MRKPNFFILGAPKCGTTSLAAWLVEHPNVFMSPVKEPNFFNTNSPKYITYTEEEYTHLFAKAKSQHIRVGEATTNYLFSQEAVPNILDYVESPSETKFIVALRNPIKIAVSLHGQRLREGREVVRDFATAWHMQKIRSAGKCIPPLSDANNLMYGPICCIGQQLERLFRIVDPGQVHTIVLDDLKKNPSLEYSRMLTFLDLPDDKRREFPVHNEARSIPLWVARLQLEAIRFKGRFAIRREFGMLKWINRNLFLRPEIRFPADGDILAELQEYFKEDIIILSEVLNRDLSHWLEPRPNK